MTNVPNQIWTNIRKMREKQPLIQNITNYVVMNTTANALLCFGASPIMAHAAEEMEEMVAICDALVINIGTLSMPWIESMKKAASAAKEKGIPVILDPVGAGASRLRTRTALDLIQNDLVSIIRGNASEILALSRDQSETKGVDSVHESRDAEEGARSLAERWKVVVSVSGSVDLIIGRSKSRRVMSGHEWMPRVTGMGCTASALTGALATVSDPDDAAFFGMAVMGVCGEVAARKAEGPGTLQLHFLDALYQLSEMDLQEYLKCEEI